VIPTIAILVSWIVVAALVVGVGRLTLSLATRWLPERTGSSWLVSAWLGLAVLYLYLQVWSLTLPVNGWSWVIPVAAAVAGLRVAVLKRPAPTGRVLVSLAVGAVLAVWFAYSSAFEPTAFDSGLYHLNAVQYADMYGTVPGLGNLHGRLGTSVSHFLFVAFLGTGPWHDAGYHLANGFLAALLAAELLTRVGGVRAGAANSPMSRAVSLMLIPVLASLVVIGPAVHLASPSIDFPAFVLVAAASLYLVDAVVVRAPSAEAVVALGLFATAATTRLQFMPSLAVASAFLLWVTFRSTERRPGWLVFGVPLLIPLTTVAAGAARTAILSGYPFYPATFAGLPVDWKVPEAQAIDDARWIRAWARAPFSNPDDVLGSWDWFRPWVTFTKARPYVEPLWSMIVWGTIAALTVVLIGLLVRIRQRDRGEASPEVEKLDRLALGALLAANATTLVVWFFGAPDPRFALAALWLVPIGVFVWVDLRWSLRGYFFATTVVGVAIVAVWTAAYPRADLQIGGGDPFGTTAARPASVEQVRTSSGILLWAPIGTDGQCWKTMRCTPQPFDHLEVRGGGVKDGFRQ
jgi:hypothetical protein